MSRLIDADKLIEDFKRRYNELDIEDMLEFMYISQLIKKQPTAFDVDKVVEKLKHSQHMLFEEVKQATSYSHEEELIENIRHYEYAIEIVKAGGLDEI